MADEENKEAEEVEVEVKPKGEGKIIVILLLLVVAVIVMTPAAVIFTLKSIGGDTEEVKKPDEEPGKDYHEVTLPEMTVNIAGTQGTRLLLFEVTVHCTDKAMEPLFVEAKGEVAVKSLLKIFKAELEQIASSKTLQELDSTNARERLSKDFRIAINRIKNDYAPQISGTVRDVLITKYLIQ